MKPRKRRAKRLTRLQVSWTLIKAEARVAILFWFFAAVSAAILGFEFLVLFKVIARTAWPLADRVFGLLRFVVVADALVLASVLWGVRHFSAFSLLDRMLTHLPVAAVGLALIGFAAYGVFWKPHSGHGPIALTDAAAMWAGSFLCFWVFLFYGRKRSATAS